LKELNKLDKTLSKKIYFEVNEEMSIDPYRVGTTKALTGDLKGGDSRILYDVIKNEFIIETDLFDL
jgi:hypothetical protein